MGLMDASNLPGLLQSLTLGTVIIALVGGGLGWLALRRVKRLTSVEIRFGLFKISVRGRGDSDPDGP